MIRCPKCDPKYDEKNDPALIESSFNAANKTYRCKLCDNVFYQKKAKKPEGKKQK